MKKVVFSPLPEVSGINDESLAKLFDWCLEHGEEQVFWYRRRSRSFKNWSKSLRLVTLMLVGAGVLAPLLNGAWPDSGISWLPLGYLAIGLSGMIYLFDKIFGLSKGWIRFMTTYLKIVHDTHEFRLAWLQMLESESAPKTKFSFLTGYLEALHKTVENETRIWASEFESSLRQLETLTRNSTKK